MNEQYHTRARVGPGSDAILDFNSMGRVCSAKVQLQLLLWLSSGSICFVLLFFFCFRTYLGRAFGRTTFSAPQLAVCKVAPEVTALEEETRAHLACVFNFTAKVGPPEYAGAAVLGLGELSRMSRCCKGLACKHASLINYTLLNNILHYRTLVWYCTCAPGSFHKYGGKQ